MANTWTTLLDAVYPVGAVYQSWSSTSPATLFGGTWTQIKSVFLYAGASAGTTGGEESKIFTIDRAQSRAAIGPVNGDISSIGYAARTVIDSTLGITYAMGGSTRSTNYFSHHVGIYGQTEESSIVPPYITCYTWRRTAQLI